MNDLAPIGHNNPLPYDPDLLADLNAKAREVADAAGSWLDLGQIDTDEQSQLLTDFVAGARAVAKEVEEARVAAKRPHDDAAKKVQADFALPAKILERCLDKAKALQTDFLRKKREAQEREQRRLAAEAQAKADEAARLAKLAEANNDLAGQVAAEDAAEQAEKLQKAADRAISTSAQSASGGGRTMALRTTYVAVVTNVKQAFLHYVDHPDVAECLRALAQADMRAAKGASISIPGVTVETREVAA